MEEGADERRKREDGKGTERRRVLRRFDIANRGRGERMTKLKIAPPSSVIPYTYFSVCDTNKSSDAKNTTAEQGEYLLLENQHKVDMTTEE